MLFAGFPFQQATRNVGSGGGRVGERLGAVVDALNPVVDAFGRGGGRVGERLGPVVDALDPVQRKQTPFVVSGCLRQWFLFLFSRMPLFSATCALVRLAPRRDLQLKCINHYIFFAISIFPVHSTQLFRGCGVRLFRQVPPPPLLFSSKATSRGPPF